MLMVPILVVAEWKEKMRQQQHRLESRDAQILKLEVQVHKLGEYNKDLSVQLKRESMAKLEEDEDFCLELESVWPMVENVKIDWSSEPEG